MNVYKFKTEVIFAVQAETFEEAMELAGLCHDEALEAIHTQDHISPVTDEVTNESLLTDEDLLMWASENIEEILNEEL